MPTLGQVSYETYFEHTEGRFYKWHELKKELSKQNEKISVADVDKIFEENHSDLTHAYKLKAFSELPAHNQKGWEAFAEIARQNRSPDECWNKGYLPESQLNYQKTMNLSKFYYETLQTYQKVALTKACEAVLVFAPSPRFH